MLKIEVKSTEIETRSGIAKATGREWKIRSQVGYVHIQNRNGTAAPYPEKITLQLDNGNGQRPEQAPYNVGIYYLSDSSIYVGDFSALRLGNPVLISEAEVQQQRQALKAAA